MLQWFTEMMVWSKANIEMWGPSTIIIVIGILFGLGFKRFVHTRLKRAAQRSKWKGDDAVLDAIEPHIVIWFFLGALSLTVNSVEMEGPFNTYIVVVLIGSITMALSRLVVSLFALWADDQDKGFPSTTMFTNIVRITVYLIGVLIIFDSLNISIAPMLTALGIGGLAVSLALKDTLSDVFAGLHILLSKKVQPGDFISLDSGEMGYITNISWRNTIMMERTNTVKIPIGVGYDSDLDLVEKVTMEVTQEIQDTIDETDKNFEPTMRFQTFGESSINLMVYFRGKRYGDQHPIIHNFIKKLHKRFGQERIEIPFPMRTVIHRNQIEE